MLAIALAVTLAAGGGGAGGAGGGAGPGGAGPAGPAGSGFGTLTTGAPTGVQSNAPPNQASQGFGNYAQPTQAGQGFGNHAPTPEGQSFGNNAGLPAGFGSFGYGGDAIGWGANGAYANVPYGWGVDEFGDLVQPADMDFTQLAYPQQQECACPPSAQTEVTPPPPLANYQPRVRNAPPGEHAVVIEQGTVKDLNLPADTKLQGWTNPKVLLVTPAP